METEVLLSLAVGTGLAAACGFRIFVPLLVMSLAARSGHLGLAEGFDWIASTPALVAFGCATLLEVAAYYAPFVDNLLDTVATPSAVVAGTVVAASQVTTVDPFLGWALALVAGGGAAGVVQGLTTFSRQISTLATAGFGNPLVATAEGGLAIVMTLMAIVVPVLAVGLLLIAFAALFRMLWRRFRRPAAAA